MKDPDSDDGLGAVGFSCTELCFALPPLFCLASVLEDISVEAKVEAFNLSFFWGGEEFGSTCSRTDRRRSGLLMLAGTPLDELFSKASGFWKPAQRR
jgi:hypothetical protein